MSGRDDVDRPQVDVASARLEGVRRNRPQTSRSYFAAPSWRLVPVVVAFNAARLIIAAADRRIPREDSGSPSNGSFVTRARRIARIIGATIRGDGFGT